MTINHQVFMTQLITAVFQSKGVTDQSLRISIRSAVAPGSDQLETGDSPIPLALRPYLNKVGRYAYKVTDRDIETLKTQGYSEDVAKTRLQNLTLEGKCEDPWFANYKCFSRKSTMAG